MPVTRSPTRISMFDCPEQIHTSPMSTLLNVTGWRPSVKVIVWGPPASGVRTVAVQCPAASAGTSWRAPSHEVVIRTVRSGAAVPQSFTSLSRCSTMLSVKMAGSFTSASSRRGSSPASNRKRSRFACVIVSSFVIAKIKR